MIVGVPREIKEGEPRIALLPRAVGEIKAAGHDVRIETRAGLGAGFDDTAYRDAGADIVVARDVWDSDLIVKVKEVQPADLAIMPKGATIFSFHHLPGEPDRTRELASKGATAIAFEMVRDSRGQFPLLAPMSHIAGRMAVEAGMKAGVRDEFARTSSGRISPEAGLRKVLVLGSGHAGMEAARTASRKRAQVVILTRTQRTADDLREQGFMALVATPESIEQHALEADLVVGAVFVPATPTPKLLPRFLVSRMKRGAVIADISIDAGGVAETSRPTTHADPTYVEEGVVHYCVPNIPAADPAAASQAISEAVLPYVLDLAAKENVATTLLRQRELRNAVLIWQGSVCHAGIAEEAWLPYTELTDALLAESQ